MNVRLILYVECRTYSLKMGIHYFMILGLGLCENISKISTIKFQN